MQWHTIFFRRPTRDQTAIALILQGHGNHWPRLSHDRSTAWRIAGLPLLISTPLNHFVDFPEGEPYSVKDASSRYAHLGYPVFPAVSLAELYKLIRTVKTILPEVHVPTLIIHSRENDAHSLRSVDLLERQLGSTVKEKLILDNSYHVVRVDYQKERVAAEVIRFFRRFVEKPARAL